MKSMKKLIVAALAVMTVVALCVPAVAFGATITITRDETYNNGTNGRTYTAFKVLDADTSLYGENSQDNKQPTYDPDGPIAYTMATNSPWADVMRNPEQIWFDVKLSADQSKYVVTMKDGVDDSDAADIAAYLKAHMPTGLAGKTITPGDGAVDVGDEGYYLLVASDGATNLTLVTTDVIIVEKNTYLTTKKTSAQTSHYVGEEINFTAEVVVPADADPSKPIILHDKMTPDGYLRFNNNVAAKIDSADFSGFTVATTGLADGCTFEVTIPETQIDNVKGKTIVFSYTATVTSAAANATGLVNELYGEEGGYKTTTVKTYDYTFDFDFLKRFKGTTEEKTAKFELRTTATDALTALKFSANGDIYTKDDSASASTVVTVTNGNKVTFHGLKEGTYYLVETETSEGYNLLAEPLAVVIKDTTTDPSTAITYTVNGGDPELAVEVENLQGTVLPSTGGMGTTILYVVGGIMIVVAAVYLVSRRRANKDEKSDDLM